MTEEAATATGAASDLVAVYPAKGLDVSAYQGRIRWRDVHADGYRFVAIKATEGTSFVDPKLLDNAPHAREAGLRVCLYHYAHPSESPRREAKHFLDVVLAHRDLARHGDIAPALDLEVTEGLDPRALWRWQHSWCELVADALHTTPILYSYLYFLEADLYLPPKHRPIWGAAYGHVPAATLARWHAWQFTSSGSVSGISGRVDLDSIRKPLPTIGRKL